MPSRTRRAASAQQAGQAAAAAAAGGGIPIRRGNIDRVRDRTTATAARMGHLNNSDTRNGFACRIQQIQDYLVEKEAVGEGDEICMKENLNYALLLDFLSTRRKTRGEGKGQLTTSQDLRKYKQSLDWWFVNKEETTSANVFEDWEAQMATIFKATKNVSARCCCCCGCAALYFSHIDRHGAGDRRGQEERRDAV
eukprot:SAG22_NODE_4366_length_1291_cov_2.568792_2_plen_195_part_00